MCSAGREKPIEETKQEGELTEESEEKVESKEEIMEAVHSSTP